MQTEKSKPTNTDKITHIKMWIGPKILPSRLIVQKDKKRVAEFSEFRGELIPKEKSYNDDEKMSYEIDQEKLDEKEKELLKKTKEQYEEDNKEEKEQYKQDNNEDVNFVLVDYQETLKKECEKFAERGENLIFVYDSSWFNEQEKSKMQAFLKKLPNNCYAVDGKDFLQELRNNKGLKVQTSYSSVPDDHSYAQLFGKEGQTRLLLMSGMLEVVYKKTRPQPGFSEMIDMVRKIIGDIKSQESFSMSDVVKVFDDIITGYKQNDTLIVKNNKVVPMYSIGNIVDFYRMIVLAKPQILIDCANKQKKAKQDKLKMSNLLYHDFDMIFDKSNDKNNNILDKQDKQEGNDASDNGELIVATRADTLWGEKFENGVMLVRYGKDNKNTAIETLLTDYVTLYSKCTDYISNKSNNKDELFNVIETNFNTMSIYEFICKLEEVGYHYRQNLTFDHNTFPMMTDEQHRSWFTYSKDLSKNNEKHEEKKCSEQREKNVVVQKKQDAKKNKTNKTYKYNPVNNKRNNQNRYTKKNTTFANKGVNKNFLHNKMKCRPDWDSSPVKNDRPVLQRLGYGRNPGLFNPQYK